MHVLLMSLICPSLSHTFVNLLSVIDDALNIVRKDIANPIMSPKQLDHSAADHI